MDIGRLLKELQELLERSKVNLGRQNTKTREHFIHEVVSFVETALLTTNKNQDGVRSVQSSDPQVRERLRRNKSGFVLDQSDAQRADDRIGNNPMG